MGKGVSIVVPVFNEEGNVAELHREICKVCDREKYEYEVIFVDDGSWDDTSKICRELKPIKYIQMRRNFGQTAAMDAGIHEAQYEYIITMDGDRQNDPEDIPNLIQYLEENELDIVSGWRKNRQDNFMKKFTSRGANFLRYLIVHDGIHDSGCSLKIYKKECFEEMHLYGEMHRFIPALLKSKGFTVGEIAVNHRPRVAGNTKYNWKRTIKGFVDMISLWFWNKFAVRPLHLLGGFGLGFLALGFACAIWSFILFVLGYKMSNNVMPPLLTVFFIIMGLMMFIFGMICDMLSKTYYGVGVDKPYSIKKILDNTKYNDKE